MLAGLGVDHYGRLERGTWRGRRSRCWRLWPVLCGSTTRNGSTLFDLSRHTETAAARLTTEPDLSSVHRPRYHREKRDAPCLTCPR